jgi:ferredoxin
MEDRVPKVHFLTEMVTVDVPKNTTLREVAMQQGIQLYRGMWTHVNCLGNGVCGRCRVWILSDAKNLSKRTYRERIVHRVTGSQRLACQVRILGDVEIRTRPIGPAVVKMTSPGSTLGTPSYKEAAEKRLVEAKAEAKKKAEVAAKKAAKKKAEEEAAKKAEEEAKGEAESGEGDGNQEKSEAAEKVAAE